MKRRILMFLLIISLSLSVIACGEKQESNTNTENNQTESVTPTQSVASLVGTWRDVSEEPEFDFIVFSEDYTGRIIDESEEVEFKYVVAEDAITMTAIQVDGEVATEEVTFVLDGDVLTFTREGSLINLQRV